MANRNPLGRGLGALLQDADLAGDLNAAAEPMFGPLPHGAPLPKGI